MKPKAFLAFIVFEALAVSAWASLATPIAASSLDTISPLHCPPLFVFSEAPLIGNDDGMALVSGIHEGNIYSATSKTGSAELCANTDSHEAAQAAGFERVIKLAGPLAALLIVVQGILCTAIVRGRRKWVLLAVPMISVGRADLNVLPRLTDAGPRPSNRPVAAQPAINLDAQRQASEAPTPSALTIKRDSRLVLEWANTDRQEMHNSRYGSYTQLPRLQFSSSDLRTARRYMYIYKGQRESVLLEL